MARAFNIPSFYRSSVVSSLKILRREVDHRKTDLAPSVLDLGPIRFKIARHFGFCYGVENAIEIAYRAIQENPGKRVFLLSEMIHNPRVNGDLMARGVRFIMAPDGTQLIPFEELSSDDIVIVPAFGTTCELFETLTAKGIDPLRYNATCPFVEKVWKRADQIGRKGYTVVIHGKHSHEETRATFSHAMKAAPSVVIRDIDEAERLAQFIRGEVPLSKFEAGFSGRLSEGFDPVRDLQRIGVVNQTTMLATETQAISDLLCRAIAARFSSKEPGDHFADTRDTLCYATFENQEATYGLIRAGADLALVVGGYNSSNTGHLVELLEPMMPTYFIKDSDEIIDRERIRHFLLHTRQVVESAGWLPGSQTPLDVIVTAGASCPDAAVDEVLCRVASFFALERSLESALSQLAAELESTAAASQ